jgi:hypothetical protein
MNTFMPDAPVTKTPRDQRLTASPNDKSCAKKTQTQAILPSKGSFSAAC